MNKTKEAKKESESRGLDVLCCDHQAKSLRLVYWLCSYLGGYK